MFRCQIEKTMGQLELDVQLEVRLGENLVIFGPSGCGKTTLLNLITGILTPDSGEIWIGKTCLYNRFTDKNMPIHNRHIGYIQQEAYLFPHLTVRDNILYSLIGKPTADDLKRYEYLIERMGIQSHVNEYPSALSGGQKQRTAICRALMMKPSFMLWDEPFSALDHSIRKEMRVLVERVKNELGIPMVFVTHDLEEAIELADVLAVMDAGQILQSGRTDQVLSKPIDERVHRILGLKENTTRGRRTESPILLHVSRELNDAVRELTQAAMHALALKEQDAAMFFVEVVSGHKGPYSFNEFSSGPDRMKKVSWHSSNRHTIFYEPFENTDEQILSGMIKLEQNMACILLVGTWEIHGECVLSLSEEDLTKESIIRLLTSNLDG